MKFRDVARLTLLIGLAASALSPAQAGEYFQIDSARSAIGFKVRHMLGTAKGKFTEFSGRIDLDRNNPEKSSVNVTILTKSIDTENRKRDDHLRNADFFNVAKYPEIVFKGRSVKQTGKQSGDIMGDLTMHGVTKPLTFHVELLSPVSNEIRRTRWMVTTHPLKRRDFGLMFGRSAEAIFGISQSVAINIEIEAVRSN